MTTVYHARQWIREYWANQIRACGMPPVTIPHELRETIERIWADECERIAYRAQHSLRLKGRSKAKAP